MSGPSRDKNKKVDDLLNPKIDIFRFYNRIARWGRLDSIGVYDHVHDYNSDV